MIADLTLILPILWPPAGSPWKIDRLWVKRVMPGLAECVVGDSKELRAIVHIPKAHSCPLMAAAMISEGVMVEVLKIAP